jgi:flagellar hook-associated protein 2
VAGVGSAFSRLSQIGVSLQKDGLLAVDSAKLSRAITSNSGDFAGLFAAVGKSSDSLVGYSAATADTVPGDYAVNVTKLATKGTATGAAPAGLVIGAGNDTLDVLLNGVSATIKLQQKSYASAAALAAEIQSKINSVAAFASAGSAVAVNETGGTLTISSSRYGSGSTVSVPGGNGAANLNLVGPGAAGVAGVDVEGTINGASATGSGQLLTGAKGGDTAGLAISIKGGSIGARGTVNYSRGYANQFEQLAAALLAPEGAVTARTNGISASIKNLTKSEEAMNLRLTAIEKRYRAQFTALDLTISKMNTTSTFLSQQLAQISNLSSK